MLVLALAAAVLTGCKDKGAADQPPVEVNVVTTKAVDTPVPVEFPAQTEAVRTVEIRPQVSGIVKRQLFKEGELVKAGDLLFEIDPQPLQVSLLQARAALAQSQAALVNAEQNYARAKPLAEQDAISKQELEAAEASARGNAASVEAAQAAVRQAELNLDYTLIRSPLNGFIGEAAIKVGGLVTQNQTLMASVSTIDPIFVALNISERGYLNWLGEHPDESIRTGEGKLNLRYTMLLANGQEYAEPGRFNFIDRAVDQQTGTIRMRLQFPNKDQMLRPGQFVRIRFPATVSSGAIVLPQRAVLSTQDMQYVFVVLPDNKIQSRDVTMGSRLRNGWIVKSGLKPGEKVVVDGLQKVHPGGTVKPVELPPETDIPRAAAAPAAKPASKPQGAK
jgi:membrane fusion protein (multidrug efflux system)